MPKVANWVNLMFGLEQINSGYGYSFKTINGQELPKLKKKTELTGMCQKHIRTNSDFFVHVGLKNGKTSSSQIESRGKGTIKHA